MIAEAVSLRVAKEDADAQKQEERRQWRKQHKELGRKGR